MKDSSTLTLHERLIIYEAVISALKNQLDMTEKLEQFPPEQQLEAIRFMQFLSDGDNLYVQDPTLKEIIAAIFFPPLHRRVH